MKALIKKYNVPGPRYTSYPTVPFWKQSSFSEAAWKTSVQESFTAINKDGISIYIHLPFCESLCTFCGCHKHITKQHSVEEQYIKTLLKEWQQYLDLFPEKPALRELHLGGGTPTFFSPEHLHQLLSTLLSTVEVHALLEMSFEGHPLNTTKEHLQTLFSLGFRRVSYGVQDYSPKVQKAINRIQPFETVKKANDTARQLGYTSISHDLVYGLPFQTKEDVKATIACTNELKPDRISLYAYAHVPWIKGVGQRGFKDEDIPAGETKRELYEIAKAALIENGYVEIGMDHFSLESDNLYQAFKKATLHRNFMGYTTNTTQLLIGLGMSAISETRDMYAQNQKVLKDYEEVIEAGKWAVVKGHKLSEEEIKVRQHILDIMCRFKTNLPEGFGKTTYGLLVMKRLSVIIKDGLVEIRDNQIIVTELGKVFIRNICMCFDLHLTGNEMDNMFSKTI